MPAEGDDGWRILRFDSGDPGACNLFAVARADIQDVRHGAVERSEFDRLMRGSVFTCTDGVMGRNVDDLELLEGAHADGWGCVEVEHKKSGSYWDDGLWCEGGHSVRYGCHGVFADTVVYITAGVVTINTTGCLKIRL